MGLESNQPLTEGTRNNSRGQKLPVQEMTTLLLSRDDCLECWEPQHPGTLWELLYLCLQKTQNLPVFLTCFFISVADFNMSTRSGCVTGFTAEEQVAAMKLKHIYLGTDIYITIDVII